MHTSLVMCLIHLICGGNKRTKIGFYHRSSMLNKKGDVYLIAFSIKSFELSLKYSIFALQHT